MSQNTELKAQAKKPGLNKKGIAAWINNYSFILIALAIFIAYLFINHGATTWSGVMNILRHSAVVGIMAFGMGLVIITGGIDLTQWNIVLNKAAVAAGDAAPVMLGIGNLLAVILDFIIVAFAMFLLVKAMNKLAALKKKDEEPAPEEPAGLTTEELLAEIRDLLKEQK